MLITAPWTQLEALSALVRASRAHRVDSEFDQAAAVHTILATMTVMSPPLGTVLIRAQRVVILHGLKALDAMHLGAALELRSLWSTADQFAFATVDNELASAARQEGLDWPA